MTEGDKFLFGIAGLAIILIPGVYFNNLIISGIIFCFVVLFIVKRNYDRSKKINEYTIMEPNQTNSCGERDFDKYIIKLAQFELNLTEQRDLRSGLNFNQYPTLIEEDFRIAELITQHCYHIQHSKNFSTIQSNYEYVAECWGQFTSHNHFLGPSAIAAVEACYKDTMKTFPAKFLNNMVQGFKDKASKLKTDVGRKKYYSKALTFLDAAEQDIRFPKDIINELRNDIHCLM